MTWKDAFEVLGGFVVGLILSYWRGLVGKYGEKSGELLAIERNLDLVLNEQQKTTEITEQIKTDLADKSVAKQKHDEMKRATALDIMRVYGNLLEASAALFGAEGDLKRLGFQLDVKPEVREKRSLAYDEANKKFRSSMTVFWQLEEITRLIFSNTVVEKMKTVKDAFNEMAVEVIQDNRKLDSLFDALRVKQDDLAKTLRVELEI
jgi:hypothetical protein